MRSACQIRVGSFSLTREGYFISGRSDISFGRKNSRLVRDLIFSLPITVLEIAHHIDEEERYDQILELRKG